MGSRRLGDGCGRMWRCCRSGRTFQILTGAVHTSPEEAVRGFVETGAKVMVPMHFGTFKLGREPMEEPVERLKLEAARLGISDKVRVLEEGETMRVGGGKGNDIQRTSKDKCKCGGFFPFPFALLRVRVRIASLKQATAKQRQSDFLRNFLRRRSIVSV